MFFFCWTYRVQSGGGEKICRLSIYFIKSVINVKIPELRLFEI
jgi:hypothetical protein